MKKKIIIISCVVIMIGLAAVYAFYFNNVDEGEFIDLPADSEKFSTEYDQVDQNNIFQYNNIDDVIKIVENGTGVIYIGFPECKWCQAYVPMLNDVAVDIGINEILYLNIKDDRSNNTNEYQKLVSLLMDKLNYDSEGNKRIYVPTVVTVLKGEIIGYNDETSFDTLGYSEPEDYWTDDRIFNLEKNLTNMINPIYLDECNSCNE